jgi:hypothetical protein
MSSKQRKKRSVPKTKPIAIIALLLSIATATFSVYQWWSGRRDAYINNTIELSKSYIEKYHDNDSKAIATVFKMRDEALKHEGEFMYEYAIDKNAKEQFWQTWSRLSYVAFLANRGRLDADYMPMELKCSIIVFSNGVQAAIKAGACLGEELEFNEFSTRMPKDLCSPY